MPTKIITDKALSFRLVAERYPVINSFMIRKLVLPSASMRWAVAAFCVLLHLNPARAQQEFEPPDGKVIYGMGQTLVRFYNDGGEKIVIDELASRSGRYPQILSDYTALGPVKGLSQSLERLLKIRAAEGQNYKLLLGVSIHEPEGYAELISGKLDDNLREWGEILSTNPIPIFIRPMYEISAGDGFTALKKYAESQGKSPGEVARKAFRYIVEKVRAGAGEEIPNLAWMWHPWPKSYDYNMEFYPGDDVVDWIGVSWFSFEGNQQEEWITHMGDMDRIAREHSKPIMVAESGPVWAWPKVPSSQVIDAFFKPYFDMMESYDSVKAFVYINTDWTTEEWLNWPDFRLMSRPKALEYFAERLKSEVYEVPEHVFEH